MVLLDISSNLILLSVTVAISSIISGLITYKITYSLQRNNRIETKIMDEQLCFIKDIYKYYNQFNQKIVPIIGITDSKDYNKEVDKLTQENKEFIDNLYTNIIILNDNLIKIIEETNKEIFNILNQMRSKDAKSNSKIYNSNKKFIEIINNDLKKEFKKGIGTL